MLLLYSHTITPRLRYIVDFVSKELFEEPIRITTDAKYYRTYTEPRINYSDQPIEGCLQIVPHTILFDHGIRDYHLQVAYHEQFKKIFFKNSAGDMPFDFFAASFWLLSRYEEYLPFKPDAHGRFHYRSSLAYQYDFIHFPIVVSLGVIVLTLATSILASLYLRPKYADGETAPISAHKKTGSVFGHSHEEHPKP